MEHRIPNVVQKFDFETPSKLDEYFGEEYKISYRFSARNGDYFFFGYEFNPGAYPLNGQMNELELIALTCTVKVNTINGKFFTLQKDKDDLLITSNDPAIIERISYFFNQ